MPVKVEIFRDLADAATAGEWSLGREAQPSLFDRIDWFARTWRHCPPKGKPLIARASDGADEVWLMLAERGGGSAVTLASWYTLAFRPVYTGASAAGNALLDAIAYALRPDVATIALDNVPAADAQRIAIAFRRAGWVCDLRPGSANWSIDVRGVDFATYWQRRPGQLRSTAKRKAAKTPMAVAIFDRFDADAWSAYCDVYADSWKPEEGSLDFLRDMAEVEGAAGTLRLGIARIEGRAVAAQLWTVEHGRAIIHKLAHRRNVAELSPGTILSRAMFERIIDVDHVDTIDFGTGDDRYKADWMDTRVLLTQVRLYNPDRWRGLRALGRARVAQLVARLRSR